MQDAKVIPNEECVPQHRLLVSTLKLRPSAARQRPFVPRRRVWKLNDGSVAATFAEEFSKIMNDKNSSSDPETLWNDLRNALLKASDKVCGWTRKTQWKEQTWWWNASVSASIRMCVFVIQNVSVSENKLKLIGVKLRL